MLVVPNSHAPSGLNNILSLPACFGHWEASPHTSRSSWIHAVNWQGVGGRELKEEEGRRPKEKCSSKKHALSRRSFSPMRTPP